MGPAVTRLVSGGLVLLVLGVGTFSGPGEAADENSGEKIYKSTLKSTVWIISPRGKNSAVGTGSLIDGPRKLILTNYHVVGEQNDAVIQFPAYAKGKVIPERDHYIEQVKQRKYIQGKVVARQPKADLAIIQLEAIPEGTQVLRLATVSVNPGQRVHSVGNPGASGALWIYSPGIVRQVYHKKWKAGGEGMVFDFESQVVETQSPTNPGDSGGPLVNDKGELVGVTQGGAADAQGLSLFIDISEVRSFLVSNKMLARLPPPSTAAVEKPAPVEKPTPAGKSTDAPDAKAEEDASRRLKLAKILADDGKADRARERFQQIIKDYPMTKAAAEAKVLLNKLK